MADLVWSDPDAEKEDFAISPRCVPIVFNQTFLTSLSEARAIRSDRASCISFLKLTKCPISSARISCAWKVTPHFSTNTYRLYGPHQTTAIGVVTPQAYSKSDRVDPCISMYSRPHQRTRGTDPVNRRIKTQVAKYVPLSLRAAFFGTNVLSSRPEATGVFLIGSLSVTRHRVARVLRIYYDGSRLPGSGLCDEYTQPSMLSRTLDCANTLASRDHHTRCEKERRVWVLLPVTPEG